MTISDPSDPRVADYVGLTDAVRRMRHDPAAGFFIAEGEKVIARAAAAPAGYPLRSVLLSPQRLDELSPDMSTLVSGTQAPVLVASYEVLEAVTGFHVHRGALASFGRVPVASAAEVLRSASRVLVMEATTNHTNLGSAFRSAAALGMDAVLLSPQSCDPLYRRSVRVSMGQVFAVPYAYLPAWPSGVSLLQEQGFRVLALTPAPDAVDLRDVVVEPADKVALLFGAEGPGLSNEAMDAADLRVRIPMSAGVDSLNVAAAAAVACWVVGHRA